MNRPYSNNNPTLVDKIYDLVRTLVIILPIAFFIRTFFYGLYQVPTGSMETTMLIGERFLADKLTIWFGPAKRGDIITFNDQWQYTYSDNSAMRLFQMYVWGPQNWTKRVIGLPGEHIKGVIEQGKPVIYINDKKFDEPYLNKYPLLALYKDNMAPGDFNSYQFRSYDPAVSYHDQPFYRMKKENAQIAQQIFARTGNAWMLKPNTPVSGAKGFQGGPPDEFDIILGENQYWVMGDNRLGSGDSRYYGPLDGQYIHGKIVFRLWSIDSYESWWIWDLIKHPIDFWYRVRWSRFFQWVN